MFRIGQGLALGGAWDGLASLLALNAPDNERGWYAMIPQLGAPLGLIVASALFAVPRHPACRRADFLDWGWRYPFFVAFAINVVALFARLRIVVTPEYTQLFESASCSRAGVAETLQAEGRNIVIGAFAPLASFALFHMVTVFPLSWVVPVHPRACRRASWSSRSSAALVGLRRDRRLGLSRRPHRPARRCSASAPSAIAVVQRLRAAAARTAAMPARSSFMVVGFALLGLSFGQSSGAVASNFASDVPLYRRRR